MTIKIDATYEDGVLKPERPLPLSEHEKVRVTVEPQSQRVGDGETDQQVLEAVRPSLAERITAMAFDLPPEVIDTWPTDGASQHDHYLYGTPKRPE